MDTNKNPAATAKTAEKTPKGSVSKEKEVNMNNNSEAKRQTLETNGNSENKENPNQKPSETERDGPLFKFFTDALKDVLYAEKHILEALPKMQKAATTYELQEAFEDHHLLTQKHISRLERVFRMIGEEPEEKKCEAIIGIVKEGESVIENTDEGSMTRDAALIIAAQKVEHYEIATYGGLAALAETLELYEASDLLHTTLQEEEETDEDLTDIAESFINFAAKEDEEEDDNQDDGLGFW